MESGGEETFTVLDYTAPTLDWAVLGSQERGFDPVEIHWPCKRKSKDITGC